MYVELVGLATKYGTEEAQNERFWKTRVFLESRHQPRMAYTARHSHGPK